MLSFITGQALDLEAEFHIATCEPCHRAFMGLRTLEAGLSRAFADDEAAPACPEEWDIGAFVKDGRDSMRISAHIKNCDYCLGQAAVLTMALDSPGWTVKTPALWKEKGLSAIAKTNGRTSRRRADVSLLKRISALFSVLRPLPSIPSYAAVAAAIITILIVIFFIPQKDDIIMLSSLEKITIRDSEVPHSFGFTGAGETVEVRNMQIEPYQGKNFIFRWTPIRNSQHYDLSFIDKASSKSILKVQPTDALAAVVSRELFEKDRLYVWLITGKTEDGRYFEYKGEFVLPR